MKHSTEAQSSREPDSEDSKHSTGTTSFETAARVSGGILLKSDRAACALTAGFRVQFRAARAGLRGPSTQEPRLPELGACEIKHAQTAAFLERIVMNRSNLGARNLSTCSALGAENEACRRTVTPMLPQTSTLG
eukprot:1236243-Rhodomonas_salina.2